MTETLTSHYTTLCHQAHRQHPQHLWGHQTPTRRGTGSIYNSRSVLVILQISGKYGALEVLNDDIFSLCAQLISIFTQKMLIKDEIFLKEGVCDSDSDHIG